jgi:site-specific DNA recombinase
MPEPASLLRVGLYARVSSDGQKENETIASQVAALEERIHRDGQVLAAELRFIDEAWSGSTLVRPALERLRDTAARGDLDRLYVYKPDRLARNYPYQFLLVQELQQCGVQVIFLNLPANPTAEERMLLEFQGIFAEYERAQILDRSRRGKRYAAQCGKVSVLSHAPYGYRYISKSEGQGVASLEPVSEHAHVVQQIFTWVGHQRLTIEQVRRRLNEQGILTAKGKSHWSRVSVWNILKNPAYQGTAVYGKRRVGERRPRLRPGRGRPEHPKQAVSMYPMPPEEWLRIPVPALVSPELFAVVQEQLAENRQRQRAALAGARHLLQGLLVCKSCGYALCGHTKAQRGGGYYRCLGSDGRRFVGGRRVCQALPLRIADLEDAVWKDVEHLLLDPQKLQEEYQRRLETPVAEPTQLRGVQAAITKLQNALNRLIDGYANGLLEKEEFEPRMRRTREQLARLQEEAQIQTDREAAQRELKLLVSRLQDFADHVKAGLQELGWEQRREVIRTLVKRIEVDEQSIRIVYRVSLPPFAKAPKGGLAQDCSNRHRAWRAT